MFSLSWLNNDTVHINSLMIEDLGKLSDIVNVKYIDARGLTKGSHNNNLVLLVYSGLPSERLILLSVWQQLTPTTLHQPLAVGLLISSNRIKV